jgi:hydroxypyruvate isomerase
MHRRDFLLKTAATTAATAAYVGQGFSPAGAAFAQTSASPAPKKNTFKLKYAPHFGMFKAHAGESLLDQLRFMADAGFTALEDNGLMKRPVADQEAIGKTLAQLNMTMGVFVIDAGDNWKVSYATGKPEFKEPFLNACRAAIDTAKRVNAKWATVVPGNFDRTLPIGIQTGHVIDILKQGADILAPANLTMVLEPLSDNPDLFLRTSDQTYMICRAVGSPACKILYDAYHMQRNEGRVIDHINWAWDEIAYFQIGDVPGRKEPGTGEMHYQNIFKHIHQKSLAAGKSFVMGMEHGNFGPGIEGERALIEAYVKADSF